MSSFQRSKQFNCLAVLHQPAAKPKLRTVSDSARRCDEREVEGGLWSPNIAARCSVSVSGIRVVAADEVWANCVEAGTETGADTGVGVGAASMAGAGIPSAPDIGLVGVVVEDFIGDALVEPSIGRAGDGFVAFSIDSLLATVSNAANLDK